MSPQNLRIQIESMAVMARVEGMKADNQLRVSRGECAANTEKDFERLACELEGLSQAIIFD